MSEEELAELERLRAAGTPGEWAAGAPPDEDFWMVYAPDDDDPANPWHVAKAYNLAGYGADGETIPGERNAALIAAAVNALPDLIKRCREADGAEDWCARLANDRAEETGLREAERAACYERMQAVRRRWFPSIPSLDAMEKAVLAPGLGHDRMPPHERTRRRLARLEAASGELLDAFDVPDEQKDTDWAVRINAAWKALRAALEGVY